MKQLDDEKDQVIINASVAPNKPAGAEYCGLDASECGW